MTREETRAIICQINSSNNGVAYCYHAATDKLLITANGGLLPEQRALITANRAAIVAYMTTPPGVSGMCQRGHAIEWKFDASGVWLCACFFAPYEPEIVEVPYQRVKEEKKSVKNYWHVA